MKESKRKRMTSHQSQQGLRLADKPKKKATEYVKLEDGSKVPIIKIIESPEDGSKMAVYYKGKKLKRFHFVWDYGYILAHNKKEAMDILKHDHEPWFVEPAWWIRPDKDLIHVKTEKATKKDVINYAENYDMAVGSIGYERDNEV